MQKKIVAGTKHGPTLFHFVEASNYNEKYGNCFFTCSSFFPENLGTVLTWKELETCALCDKVVEKIVERWRRASPFVTWSFMGFGPLETGVSNFGDGHLNFGDGGLSLETGVSIWRRGSPFGDGHLPLSSWIGLASLHNWVFFAPLSYFSTPFSSFKHK